MNRKLALAIAAAPFAAGNAFTDDITIDTTPFVSTKSRAEVQAELARPFPVGGSPWSMRYDPLAGFKSRLSRAQVQAEFMAARDEVSALTGEETVAPPISRAAWKARSTAPVWPASRSMPSKANSSGR